MVKQNSTHMHQLNTKYMFQLILLIQHSYKQPLKICFTHLESSYSTHWYISTLRLSLTAWMDSP